MLSTEEKTDRQKRTRNIKTFVPDDDKDYVFISYKSDNWETVLVHIVEQMQNRYGLRVYYDANFDRDNYLWVDNMKRAIKSSHCKALLSFISKEYMESYACLMELLYTNTNEATMTHKKSGRKIPIIPILLNGIGDIDAAVSKSNEKITVKEWDIYWKLLESARKYADQHGREEVKSAIEVLITDGEEVTVEQMSCAMNELLDGNHVRYWSEDNRDNFFEALKETLCNMKPEDQSVFDENLIKKAEDPVKKECREEKSPKTRIAEVFPTEAQELQSQERLDTELPGAVCRSYPGCNGKVSHVLQTLGIIRNSGLADNYNKVFNKALRQVAEAENLKSYTSVAAQCTTQMELTTQEFVDLTAAWMEEGSPALREHLLTHIGRDSEGINRSTILGFFGSEDTEKAAEKHPGEFQPEPGKPQRGRNAARDKAEETKKAGNILTELLEEEKISNGETVCIPGYDESDGIVTDSGMIKFRGKEWSLKEYMVYVSGPAAAREDPGQKICIRKNGRTLAETVLAPKETEKAETAEMTEIPGTAKNRPLKKTEIRTEFIPEEVTPTEKTAEGEITLGEIRSRFAKDTVFCFDFRKIRQEELPRGSRAYTDYAMAAVLSGCDNLKFDYQFNYYNYCIANFENKRDDAKAGATWTWSSNARKTIGYEGSGALDYAVNGVFAALPDSTTVNDLIRKFEACNETAYITKKNNFVILALRKLAEACRN